MITVVVIEGNRMVRENVATMLNALPDVSVQASADAVAMDALERIAPRVVLLNVGLAHCDFVLGATRVGTESGGCAVVVMDVVPAHDSLAKMVTAGVAGFILKEATCDEFVQTIRSVAMGASVLPECLLGSLFAQLANSGAVVHPSKAGETVHLTPRELEVIALIAQGRSNKQIAAQLAIAEHTAKTHVRNVMSKLSLNTRLQIATYAHQPTA